MKKIWTVTVAAAMVLSLAGCSSKPAESQAPATQAETPAETKAAEEKKETEPAAQPASDQVIHMKLAHYAAV